MLTLIILAIVLGAIVGLNHIASQNRPFSEYSPSFLPYTVFCLPGMMITVIVLIVLTIIPEVSHPSTIATPAKYTNQNYYIDHDSNLYVDKNGSMQFIETPEKQLIQYNDLAKSASVEFKTTKTLTADMSDWIPFYFESKTKTSISKITLPKAALTEKLTKVTVLNSSQSDVSDLSLAD